MAVMLHPGVCSVAVVLEWHRASPAHTHPSCVCHARGCATAVLTVPAMPSHLTWSLRWVGDPGGVTGAPRWGDRIPLLSHSAVDVSQQRTEP